MRPSCEACLHARRCKLRSMEMEVTKVGRGFLGAASPVAGLSFILEAL